MYIEEPAKLYDTTNPDWVPSVNMGYTSYHAWPRPRKIQKSRTVSKKEKNHSRYI